MEDEYDYDFIFNKNNQLRFYRFCTSVEVNLFKLKIKSNTEHPQEMMEEFLNFNEEI